MTRARKFDPTLLEREYVYDSATPPVSLTGLADRHGMNRGHLSDMARRGEWYTKRKEIRKTVGEKVLDAMTDRWAETQTLIRDRMLEMSVKMLDAAEKALADGEIKITKPTDVATIIATMRVLLGDQAVDEARKNGPTVIDMETVTLTPEKMAEMLPLLKQLAAGKEADDSTGPVQGHAGTDAPSGPAGVEQN